MSLGISSVVDPAFSRDLGAKGWLGMALPKEYGGGGRTAVERLVVSEELFAVGAPTGYHWIADRQYGPSIAKYGTEEQKQYFLPRISKGELSFAIGMSEPDSGSDLASVRTKAQRVDDGWLINGTKIWTSGANEATHIIGLFRTSEERHTGLTQFIVDRHADGLTVSPIPFIDGTRHFCEVSFVDVFVPDSRRLGKVGAGWEQNTADLILERAGVDRWMSMMPILENWVLSGQIHGDRLATTELGVIAARCWTFRGMSLAVARMVDKGNAPAVEAALIKEMSTRFEQDCVETVARHLGRAPDLASSDPNESLLARAILVAPSWSIRGGTSEILRTIIVKGLDGK
jgi:alkylation response protein AidB-like acyl-CoA dehydrogenase